MSFPLSVCVCVCFPCGHHSGTMNISFCDSLNWVCHCMCCCRFHGMYTLSAANAVADFHRAGSGHLTCAPNATTPAATMEFESKASVVPCPGHTTRANRVHGESGPVGRSAGDPTLRRCVGTVAQAHWLFGCNRFGKTRLVPHLVKGGPFQADGAPGADVDVCPNWPILHSLMAGIRTPRYCRIRFRPVRLLEG